ncbi:MAG: HNH endonuclease [Candidatus Stahlbacteria bacterium]|nr:HNH endonuclease [Candidatus Stahlbacteria bacterium]
MDNYIRNKDDKYLVSGPAPIGRLLNYIKRIAENNYKTSIRGPGDNNNLDDWTVCFMVDLGLINKPVHIPNIKITLTDAGKKIYDHIRNSPNFIDNPRQAKENMRQIKNALKRNHIELYNLIKKIILESDPLKNLSIYFKNKNIASVEKQIFYTDFGKNFGIEKAGFNRLPSLLQCAEFCDILTEGTEEKGHITIYDEYYIKGQDILTDNQFLRRKIDKAVSTYKEILETEELEDIDEFLKDKSKALEPQKREIVVKEILRDAKKSKRLKAYYDSKCQICNKEGFIKKNEKKYSESHHLVFLGEAGSNDYSNIIIVCPDCHRKLHYAKVQICPLVGSQRKIWINDEEYYITYKPEHRAKLQEND